MNKTTRSEYDSVRNFANKAFRSGCYAPYVSLYFNSVGNVLACCKNDTFLLGNVGSESLKDIWNGGEIKRLRQTLAEYQFEAGCEFCEWQIGEGNYRPAFPTLFEEFPVDSLAPEWPAMIEFAGSNTCNFECIMCYGELSSSIRAHRDGLPPLPRYYSDKFFEELREFLPHLKSAKFLGGEPFLASETFRIWDMMIEQGLAIPCHVTTNASQYSDKVKQVLDSLPISFTVSIDGTTRETFEKIRMNSNFEEVFENLHRFHEYTRKTQTFFSIAFCLLRQNWHEFIDVLLLAETLDCALFVNTVISPSYCSLYTLPANTMLQIADEIENAGIIVEDKLVKNHHVWRNTIAALRGKSEEGQAPHVEKIMGNYYKQRNHWTISWDLANCGQKKEALEEIRKVKKGEPFYYQAVAYSAEIQREMGDWEGAERDLQQAMKISARRPEAFLYMAKLRLDQNRLEEALNNALQAEELVTQEDPLQAEVCDLIHSIKQVFPQ